MQKCREPGRSESGSYRLSLGICSRTDVGGGFVGFRTRDREPGKRKEGREVQGMRDDEAWRSLPLEVLRLRSDWEGIKSKQKKKKKAK